MGEITPKSVPERVFAILVFLIAFVGAAWFVSSLTSSMTQLNIIGSDVTRQLTTLRLYLRQSNISDKLALRVQRNAQHALAEQQRALPESAVGLLSIVSEPLRVEIETEMYAPILSWHPFFKMYIEAYPHIKRKVCRLAVSMVPVSVGDIVFSAGEMLPVPKMFIVCDGAVRYDMFNGDTVQVNTGDWCAEPVLWTSWVHRGDLVGTGNCKLCVVDVNSFQSISLLFLHDTFDPREYAEQFVQELNALDQPSDLRFDSGRRRRSSGTVYGQDIHLPGQSDILRLCSSFVRRCLTTCIGRDPKRWTTTA